jgi:GT2 family glycosyltransferase
MIAPREVGDTASGVGVVIVNFNAKALLLDAVGSIAAQTLQAERVVVIDNASSDESAAAIAVSFPGVTLIRLDENIGFAAANNIGIAMLDDCELVALLNPDATADPDWLATLVAAAEEHPEMAAFASLVERAGDAGRLDSAGDVYHVYGTAWPGRQGAAVETALAEEEVFGPTGAAALYRRDWLVRLGGFDESFFCYFEDVDLNLRLQVAGGRCLYVPEARVRHVGGATTGGLSTFTIYHSQRNLVWTYVKSMPPHLFWRYLPMHLLLNVGSVVSYGVRGHSKTLLRAKRDALRGLPAILRARRGVMASRAFDQATFDGVMRRGTRTLLRETRP